MGPCNLGFDNEPLNGDDNGFCYLNGPYNIPGDSEGNSELTGDGEDFTCVEVEVYEVTKLLLITYLFCLCY
jgi:hypothetical protein